MQSGDTLDGFDVIAMLGKGGMGEVYRARDNKLGRNVAIKVLPKSFADDPERLGRFEREAQILASLNHINIATVFGFNYNKPHDVHYLVMELIDGETLTERLASGPQPVNELLTIFIGIAHGLEAAHEAGIVHRDLKPDNVKISSSDVVKILDFGIAKNTGLGSAADAVETITALDPAAATTPMSPVAPTAEGTFMGTPVYMSPEQARGKSVDKRTDIWAFGCCLYEALTGELPFKGDTIIDTLGAITQRDPDWDKLPATVSPQIRSVLRRCLEKDAKRRLSSAGDLAIQLEEARDTKALAVESLPVQEAISRSRGLTLFVAAIALVAGAGITYALTRSQPQEQYSSGDISSSTIPPQSALAANDSTPRVTTPPKKFQIDIGAADLMGYSRVYALPALSQDGMQVAYTAAIEGQHGLYLHDLASLETTFVPETRTASGATFAPDGRSIFFFLDKLNVNELNPNILKRLTIATGQIEKIAEAVGGGVVSLNDGSIYFTRQDVDSHREVHPYVSNIYRIPNLGGEPERVTIADGPTTGEWSHAELHALPDDRGIVFTVFFAAERNTALLDAETAEYRIIIENARHPHYVDSGHIVFNRGSQVWAVPFDLETLSVTGDEVRLFDGLDLGAGDLSTFSVSRSGALVYLPERPPTEYRRRLVWVDHQGHEAPLDLDYGAYIQARASYDGKHVAVAIGDDDFLTQSNIYIHDLDRPGSLRRLTTEQSGRPTWVPLNPKQLIYGAVEDGRMRIMARRVDGLGEPQLLYRAIGDSVVPNAMTPTGDRVFFGTETRETSNDVSMLFIEPNLEEFLDTAMWKRKTDVLIATPANEGNISFSPDSKFFAYSSAYQGKVQALVRPYPNADDAQWTINTGQGNQPRWSPDGSRIYYQNGGEMYVVDVRTEPSFTAGTPRLLFDKQYFEPKNGYVNYDLEYPEGNRFLFIDPLPELNTTKLIYIENWHQELITRVPPREDSVDGIG